MHFGTDNPTRLKNLTGPKLIFWADESADSKSILSYSSGLHFSFFQNRPDRGALINMSENVFAKVQNKKGRQWYMPDIISPLLGSNHHYRVIFKIAPYN